MNQAQQLNAAQLDRVHRYAAELLQGVQLRKWAIEKAAEVSPSNCISLAQQIYAFVTSELSADLAADTLQATEPPAPGSAERPSHNAKHGAPSLQEPLR